MVVVLMRSVILCFRLIVKMSDMMRMLIFCSSLKIGLMKLSVVVMMKMSLCFVILCVVSC